MHGPRTLALVLVALELVASADISSESSSTVAIADPEGSNESFNTTALLLHCYNLKNEIQAGLSHWTHDRAEDYLKLLQTGVSMEPVFEHRGATLTDREVAVSNNFDDMNYVQSLVDLGVPVKVREADGGDETIAYVKHMVENYDSDRKLFAFLRGNPEKQEEAPLGLFKYLAEEIDPEKVNKIGGYASFNHAYHKRPESSAHKLLEFRMDCIWRDDFWVKHLRKRWSLPEWGGFSGKGGRYCCSQFAVTREALRANPKEFYTSLLERVSHDFPWESTSWKTFGGTMSALWHVLFTGQVDEPKYTYADIATCPAEGCHANKHHLQQQQKQ